MSGSPSPIIEAPPLQPVPAPALPRLLAGIPAHGPMDLEAHSAVHGAPAASAAGAIAGSRL